MGMIQAVNTYGNGLYFDLDDVEIVLTNDDCDGIRIFFKSGMTATLTADSGHKVLEAKLRR